ncbi:hypothetical protein PV08_07095 [Exophiala spinifera]|uniref:Uncharacterized protein n=1 Tax=Exophiala spinifera TaxID=91928 RepID=A0A0D2B5W8_9EURO|nr:uncharacterized protein PV08_07095 [Exophiala spinifera]KIW14313.1 hypothetical protein PV08_07095 [Exophiala spinifera]
MLDASWRFITIEHPEADDQSPADKPVSTHTRVSAVFNRRSLVSRSVFMELCKSPNYSVKPIFRQWKLFGPQT